MPVSHLVGGTEPRSSASLQTLELLTILDSARGVSCNPVLKQECELWKKITLTEELGAVLMTAQTP